MKRQRKQLKEHPQSFTASQLKEIELSVHRTIIKWISRATAIVLAVTGAGLWQIARHVEDRMENLVARQFEEPRIQATVAQVASDRANITLEKQIQPEILKFKKDGAAQLNEIGSANSDN